MRAFRAALRHELLLQRRQLRTLLLIAGTAVLMGPILLQLGELWIGATEGAVKRSTQSVDLPLDADPAIAAWIRPEDGIVVTRGPLATADPVAEGEVLGQASLVGDAVVLRRPLRVVKTSALSERLERVIDRENAARRTEAMEEAGLDPEAFALEVTRAEREGAARGGDAPGRVLPGLLVFLLLTAALYAAIDVVTGEKEKGTAETLLSTPIPRASLLAAKATVVWSVATGAGAFWAASLWAAQATGLLHAPALLGPGAVFTASTAAVLTLCAALLAAQVGAASLALAAWAPGYRQASVAAVPLMLAGMAPTALAALPDAELRPLVIALPIANVAVGLKGWLTGAVGPGGLLAVGGAAVGHCALALAFTAWLGARTDALDKGLDAESRRASGRFGPDAVGLFAVGLVGFWFFGLLAQASHLLGGLAATMFGLAALAVGGVAFLGAPVRRTLSLGAPRPPDAALAVAVGLTVHAPAHVLLLAIQPVLPMPADVALGLTSLATDHPLPLVLLVAAVLPGLCEELFFRGAVLGLLRTSLPAGAAVAASSAMFGLLHLELSRVVVTGAMGVLFGLLVVRSGSLWTGALAHGVNNALLFASFGLGFPLWEGSGPAVAAGLAACCAVAFGGTWATGRQNRPS